MTKADPVPAVSRHAATAQNHGGTRGGGGGAVGSIFGGTTTGRPHFMHPNESPGWAASGRWVAALQLGHDATGMGDFSRTRNPGVISTRHDWRPLDKACP